MIRLLSTALIFAGASLTALNGFALEIIKDGKPLAEIVVPEKALPQVNFAAKELQEHLLKMSGAKLPITAKPDFEHKKQIYVGESKYTRKIGLNTNGLKMEGYKIATGDNYLALLGRDAIFPRYPRGFKSQADRPRLLEEWQEYCGEKWHFPFLQIYDPRNYNKELGFSLYDPTGTLFAVYEFLERQGVRWYMPYHEFGTIIPEKKDVAIEKVSVSKSPVFSKRYLRFCWGNDTEGFLWFKRQKLGMSEMTWIMHGTNEITKFTKDKHPEYLARIGGVVYKSRGKDQKAGIPRLAPPLRDAMSKYIEDFFRRYPEMNYASAGPSDAYTSIDDRDLAAGWLREKRGHSGRLSDYVWTFINDVAKKVKSKYPNKTVMGLAYTFYRKPPEDIKKFSDNVGVCYCQHRGDAVAPDNLEKINEERKKWLRALPSKELFIWEYYLWQRPKSQLYGVPIFFPKIMQKDIKALRGKSKGEYVEAWAHGKKLWGINHLTYYLQAKLYWNPDLDIKKAMDEYFEKFYGPAKNEMKEFFEFAEKVWMRPASRTITLTGGFLKQSDIDRFFSILNKAKAKTGNSVYGKRIDIIIEDCQPMKNIYAKLERTGPDFLAPKTNGKPQIDGKLDDAFWKSSNGEFRPPVYHMRNLHSGKEAKPETTVLMRWAKDNSGLYIAVDCNEPRMDLLRPQINQHDSFSIFDNDVVEIFIDTPKRATFRAAINANGAIYDACTDPAVKPSGQAWNPNWNFAVKRGKKHWSVELFIPRKSLDNAEIPNNKHPWGINVCRTRLLSGKPENSAIAPTKGPFLTPSKFGNLTIK